MLFYRSKFTFDNGVVGKALKGPICTYEYSGGVNNNHSPVIGLVATTIAHEMGHNFGKNLIFMDHSKFFVIVQEHFHVAINILCMHLIFIYNKWSDTTVILEFYIRDNFGLKTVYISNKDINIFFCQENMWKPKQCVV